ncbi:hypothetical protein AX15_004689 [Amanita polypyramis BW_CC]|nr:hypothetical protein AX15_004689 [Amanita polypyramis BW_CC]
MSRIIEVKSSPDPGSADNKRNDSDSSETTPVFFSVGSEKRRRVRSTSMTSASPGPSTSAVQTRSAGQGRKLAKNMPIIELTDSESDDAAKPQLKRARLTNKRIAPMLKGESSAIAPFSSLSKSDQNSQEKDRGKGKEKAVPLFMDSDEENGPSADNDENLRLPAVVLALLQNSEKGADAATAGVDQARSSTTLDEEDEAGNVSNAQNEETVPDAQQEQQQNEDSSNKSEGYQDMLTRYMAQTLEIIPDVTPDYLFALLTQLYPQHKAGTVDFAIQMLFEDVQYPKVERKEKRKSETGIDDRVAKKARTDYVDYSRQDRPCLGSPAYTELALEYLQTSFPYVPKPYARKILVQHGNLYAPSHIYFMVLFKQHKQVPTEHPRPGAVYPFFPRKTPYRSYASTTRLMDAEFDKERRWVMVYEEEEADVVRVHARLGVEGDKNVENRDEKGKGKEKETDDDQVSEDECPEGEGIECGCCFSEYHFEKMIQCPETHLFCKRCMVSYTSNVLGEHNIKLKCMHQDGCTHTFPESELRRALPQRLIDLYDRLKQQKEIEEANLEGLEECPFCDYKCVIEVDKTQEKLFRCGNIDGGCGAVSCRKCKRPDHLPKSCKEMDEEKLLNNQHTVEEAMSAAMMRSCPKCKKPFIKEYGCNKITCTSCGTFSCYVCRQVVDNYEHFEPVGYILAYF